MRCARPTLVTVEVFLPGTATTPAARSLTKRHRRLTLPTRLIRDVQRTRKVDYPENWVPRYADAYRIELQEVDSIQQGRRSALATAEDGLRAALAADAVTESMHSGERR